MLSEQDRKVIEASPYEVGDAIKRGGLYVGVIGDHFFYELLDAAREQGRAEERARAAEVVAVLADDLEAELRHRYGDSTAWARNAARLEQDMEPVAKARAYLSTLTTKTTEA